MDNHYVQLILHYLHTHPHFGIWFTCVVAFSESLPIVGTIVPGSVTMTALGVLVGMDVLPLTLTLVLASASAFLGDCVGFGLGYWYTEKIKTIWPFRKYPKWIAMGEKFFAKHGGKSIILGRFIGPARSTVPLIAGLMRLTWLRFCIAAIPSAIIWALMYTVPGILIGALSREVPKGETTRFLLYALLVLAVLWGIYWLVQRFFIELARFINKMTDRLWNYLTKKHAGRFLIRLITNHQKETDHHQLTLLLASLTSGVLFLLLLIKVMQFGVLKELNLPIFHLLQSIRTPLWDKIFVTITVMGMPKTVAIMTGLLLVGFAIKKQWRTTIIFLSGFVVTCGAVEVFKKISTSVRPQGVEIVAHSSSFPSGHTTISFFVFLFLAFLISTLLQKHWRSIPWTLASIFIACVAFSRLYLGAHWITDIIGSILLGSTLLLPCIVAYRRMPKIQHQFHLSRLSCATILCISFFISWAIALPTEFHKNLFQYKRTWPTHNTSLQTWWNHPLRYTPIYRSNRLGKIFQPLNVQYVGSLKKIKSTLIKNGWEIVAGRPKLKTSLQRFVSFEGQYHMPLLPWLYRDKPPVLLMIKTIENRKRIIELRLWDSEVTLHPGHQKLWIGATDILMPPKKLMSLKEQASISLANGGGLNVLLKDADGYQNKILYISKTQQPPEIHSLKWNGDIVLLK